VSRLRVATAIALKALPLLGCALSTGCNTSPDLGPRNTELPGEETVLPTRLVHGLWLLQVRLPNVAGDHRLLIDTGTDRTLLDLPLAQSIGLNSTGDEIVRTATGEEMSSSRLDRLPWLGAGEVTFRDIEVAGVDLQPLRETGGVPIVGIAGCDLFRQCVLELDYRRRRARVAPRSRAPSEGGHPFNGRLPWISVRAAGEELRVLVDTGFQHALAVPTETPIRWLSEPRQDGELATLDGVADKHTARLDGVLEFDEIRLRNPLVVVAPGHPKIGTALLRRCRLLLDVSAGRIWIEPARRR